MLTFWRLAQAKTLLRATEKEVPPGPVYESMDQSSKMYEVAHGSRVQSDAKELIMPSDQGT